MEPVAPGGAVRGFRHRLDLGRALHVHGIGPAVGLVHQVAQAVEGALVAGRGNVEAAATVQLHARRAEMKLDAILAGVAQPEAGVAVGIEAGESDLFETVDHLLLLVFGGDVLASKADDAGAIGPFVRAGVDQVDHALGIAAHDLRQRFACHVHRLAGHIADQIAIVVISKHRADGQVVYRSRTAALAVGEELDQHPGGLRCCARISASSRAGGELPKHSGHGQSAIRSRLPDPLPTHFHARRAERTTADLCIRQRIASWKAASI